MLQHRIRSLLACSTSLLLMACGGGGSGGNTGALSTSDVTEVAQALGATGEGMATRGSTLDLQIVPPSLIAGTQITASTREQPLAISISAKLDLNLDLGSIVYTNPETEYPCTVLLDEGCTGSLIVEASYPHDATAVPAGSHITRTFNALHGTRAGREISLNGTTRTDFLTAVDFTQPPANVRVQITNTEFSNHIDGVGFGPHTGVALLEFDANGALTYTVDNVSYSGMSNIVVTDRDNFSVGAATVRRPHWSTPDTYVVYVYQSWIVTAGRPAVGSTVTISTEGVAGSCVVTVATSSATRVTYNVRSTVGGVVGNYLVTVDYPPDAVPVWSAVEVGA